MTGENDGEPARSATPVLGRVIAVRYATLVSRRSELFYRYHVYGESDAEMRMDYYFWVVRNEDAVVLVDTGFDPGVGARRGRTCLCPPLEALDRLGIPAESVSKVVVTHLHYDHIGNLDAFPAAELVVPERELEFWNGPAASRRHFADAVEPDEVARVTDSWRSGRVRAVGGEQALGDGITVIDVGGHSAGQQVVVVDAGASTVILTSDSVHFYEELEREWPFAVLIDLADMYSAYDTVRALGAQQRTVVVPSHDPAVMDRFPRHVAAPELAVNVA
jgi:glyoxylase-like metal-dependent hydrolase (beta-lactamase superfamily II)